MPIYTYQCPSCKKEVDKIHGVQENITFVCNDCTVQLEKVIAGGQSFKGKGPGWFGNAKKPGRKLT